MKQNKNYGEPGNRKQIQLAKSNVYVILKKNGKLYKSSYTNACYCKVKKKKFVIKTQR